MAGTVVPTQLEQAWKAKIGGRLTQPVIAEVKGIATAAGCQLVASCDLAVASEEARFATSWVTDLMMPALVLMRSSRLIPGFRGMPAVMMIMSDPLEGS